MNIISINCNGSGKGEFKVPWINSLIKKHNASVIGIQETKRKSVSNILVRNIWGSHDYDFDMFSSVGQGG